MSLRNRFQSGLCCGVLVAVFVNVGALAAQTANKHYELIRPTRFNATSNGGTGLLQSVSPYTLEKGEFVVGASEMNFDRDPGDIDLFQFGFQGAVGVGKRTEVFARVMPWSRANSTNLDPVRFPVPPLDLFVDIYPTSAVRNGPYFAYVPNLPYKTYSPTNLTETGAFSASSGDNLFGAKVNLRSEDRGNAMGLGVRGFVEIPTEKPRYNVPYPGFRNLVGSSGKVNYGGELLLARTWKAGELTGNIGYKQTGNPERGLRIQMVDSSQSTPDKFLVGAPVNSPLRLSNELRFSTGWTVPAFHYHRTYWWLITEFNHTHYVGSHTPTERLVHPAEVSVGLQSTVPRYHNISIGATWQLLLNDGGKGQNRSTSLKTPDGRGDINFSELLGNPQLTADVKAFFASRGASFSEASSKVFSTNNAAFDSWRNIPVNPEKIRSAGHTNVLVFISWRAGGKAGSQPSSKN